MKTILNVITLVTAMVSFSVPGRATDGHGHNHDAPGLVQAPKGGLIKSLDSIHVEVVNKGKDVQIHFYGKDMNQVDAEGIKVFAEVELPRVKSREKVTLKPSGQSLEYIYDAKKSHRYTLYLTVTDPQEKHATTLSYTIEPKKGK